MVKSSKQLVIRDEIHGDMSFDEVVHAVIDHPIFQRLRYIKQLGLAEYVFPCATHTRFQHSMGAAFLASKYFESLVGAWTSSPFQFEGEAGDTRLFGGQTIRCVESVANHPGSLKFWSQATTLAGLLHDVGHGPWSHTFEYLALPQDFSEVTRHLPGVLGDFFKEQDTKRVPLMHEEVSVIYIYKILKDLTDEGQLEDGLRFLYPVTMLVNKKMSGGTFKKQFEAELLSELQKRKIQGGMEMLRLLRPLISGPFDVDRIDYIQRDGRNCGVSMGGIEWRRIVTKVIPCLAHHKNNRKEPTEVVLLSNLKNQHVLDDFVFSLFQMYAQVYMHPKIVGIEDTAKRILAGKSPKKKTTITLDVHSSFSDEKFRQWIKEEMGAVEVEATLLRRPGYTFRVASLPMEESTRAEMAAQGFSLIQGVDRPMMKDSMGLYLYSPIATRRGNSEPMILRNWTEVSPVAHQFFEVNYSPAVWIRPDELKN